MAKSVAAATESSGGGGMRVTTEYDSDSRVLVQKVSCKVLEGLAKLKLSLFIVHGGGGDEEKKVVEPQVTLSSKHLSIHYDVKQQNCLVKASAELAPGLQLGVSHDLSAQQGEVSMVADLAPHYNLQLTSSVPSFDLPKATLRFPLGQVSLEEDVNDDETKILSINGILRAQLLNGVCNALYQDHNFNLTYAYKDDQMTFIPSISLPSNVFSFAFKRRFSPSNKFSYWYNFDTNYWSAVYKHTIGKDLKVKAGYDSEVRLSWASLWVGDEAGTAKSAPMKMKVQVMVQVPRDDVRSSGIMFRVKKRWDLFC